MLWVGVLGVVGIAAFFGAFYSQRVRSTRQAAESAARESTLVREVALANKEAEHSNNKMRGTLVAAVDAKRTQRRVGFALMWTGVMYTYIYT